MKRQRRKRNRRQRGGFIPGAGILEFMSASGRNRARRTGMKKLEKDADFLGMLLKAYGPKKLRRSMKK